MGKKLKKARSAFVVRIVFVLFCVIAIFSAIMLIQRIYRDRKERAAFEELSKLVSPPQTTQQIEPGNVQDNSDNFLPVEESPTNPYAELALVNSDFAAWIRIPETEVDYPVMFTPSEPEYYLRRAFDKTDSQSGTPFVGAGASLDSSCFIIYGHNMKNGTMFGSLENYRDPAFWAENKIFTLDTLDEQRVYEIFSVVETEILAADIVEFQYYHYVGDLSELRFFELIEKLQEQALYNTQIDLDYGDQIVILSTCSYHAENGRLIVAAKRSN